MAKTKKILITGGAGFVGSNLALFLQKKIKKAKIICLDNFLRQGSRLNAERLKGEGVSVMRGDVRRKKDLSRVGNIDWLIDCAAEPSVLASYKDPQAVIDINLGGTLNCLEFARSRGAGMIFLSTNRVYPVDRLSSLPIRERKDRFDLPKTSKGPGYSYRGVREDFPLTGHRSVYGASKLSSELFIQEYFSMFGLKGVVNRCGVIAGPWQMGRIDQGIVGYWTICHKFKRPLKYIGFGGSGKQLRDCLHVDDLNDLILYQLHHIKQFGNGIFNVGGGRRNSFSLKELTATVRRVTGESMSIKKVKTAREGDIPWYITDNTLVRRVSGWSPKKNVTRIVEDIHLWLEENVRSLKKYLAEQK